MDVAQCAAAQTPSLLRSGQCADNGLRLDVQEDVAALDRIETDVVKQQILERRRVGRLYEDRAVRPERLWLVLVQGKVQDVYVAEDEVAETPSVLWQTLVSYAEGVRRISPEDALLHEEVLAPPLRRDRVILRADK